MLVLNSQIHSNKNGVFRRWLGHEGSSLTRDPCLIKGLEKRITVLPFLLLCVPTYNICPFPGNKNKAHCGGSGHDLPRCRTCQKFDLGHQHAELREASAHLCFPGSLSTWCNPKSPGNLSWRIASIRWAVSWLSWLTVVGDPSPLWSAPSLGGST